MKAIVDFTDGSSSLVKVNLSYSRGGVHYYDLTINSEKSFLNFTPGVTKLFTKSEINKLTYIMS
jgi:hypothetical protein